MLSVDADDALAWDRAVKGFSCSVLALSICSSSSCCCCCCIRSWKEFITHWSIPHYISTTEYECLFVYSSIGMRCCTYMVQIKYHLIDSTLILPLINSLPQRRPDDQPWPVGIASGCPDTPSAWGSTLAARAGIFAIVLIIIMCIDWK